jgi:DNA-binding PucR family transcriptional regulator
MLTTSLNSLKEYVSIIDKHIIAPIFKDSMIKDIILTYFKNDLNVSKTAKDLYINRNSLLNKFEIIYKETGFNLQKFNHACAIYLFVLSKGNNMYFLYGG